MDTNSSAVKSPPRAGFTLIELSIVLVIIGLIIGGILVGRDLINAATVRAQISQIEKYNTAVNTFRLKFGYLPGDIPDPTASAFGFAARGTVQGTGDGNGVIEGNYCACAGEAIGVTESVGETVMFWVDLSTAGLISGGFNTASATVMLGADITTANIGLYLPRAALGGGSQPPPAEPGVCIGTAQSG